MSDKLPKRPRDPNQLAKSIIDIATGEKPHDPSPGSPDGLEHARRGGLKGGQARADKLSPDERAAIAKKGAAARWKKS